MNHSTASLLTRSIRDSETSIDFVQGPPGSRRERVKKVLSFCEICIGTWYKYVGLHIRWAREKKILEGFLY